MPRGQHGELSVPKVTVSRPGRCCFNPGAAVNEWRQRRSELKKCKVIEFCGWWGESEYYIVTTEVKLPFPEFLILPWGEDLLWHRNYGPEDGGLEFNLAKVKVRRGVG